MLHRQARQAWPQVLKPEEGPRSQEALAFLQGVGFAVQETRASWDALMARAAHQPVLCTNGSTWLLMANMPPHGLLCYRLGQAGPEGAPMTSDAVDSVSQSVSWVGFEAAPEGLVPSLAGGVHGSGVSATAPGPGQTQGASTHTPLGWAWLRQAIRPYRGVAMELMLASLFIQLKGLVTPLVFQVVIDKVLTHRTMSTLVVIVLALLGLTVFEALLSALRHYVLTHTSHRLEEQLSSRLFSHLLRLPLAYFQSRRSGEVIARVRELDQVRQFVTGPALTAGLDAVFSVVYLSVMATYSWKLTVVVLLCIPLLWGTSAWLTPLLRQQMQDQFALKADNQAYLVETISAMETLKSQAVETRWQGAWQRRLLAQGRSSVQGAQLAYSSQQAVSVISKLLMIALLWLGVQAVMDGELTVGGLMAFNMLSSRINGPLLSLANTWPSLAQVKVSMARLADIWNAPAETPSEAAVSRSVPTVQGGIAFEHVRFRYHEAMPWVLDDFSAQVLPGEIIGIVGLSGTGKSTLLRLIQGLYSPQAGRVLVDGLNVQGWPLAGLRHQLGVVSLDSVLLNTTVRDNIAFADPGLDMAAVVQAAQWVGAHEFIMQLPQAYDTVVGEQGRYLSSGQRARIAMARSLVHQPRVLLWDEATACLDYESERAVHEHLAHIVQGRTVLLVAHRLSTLRLAPRIWVLDRGRLVEDGSHAQLLALGGLYARLYAGHQALDRTPDSSVNQAFESRMEHQVKPASLSS